MTDGLRLIVAGSRGFTNFATVKQTLNLIHKNMGPVTLVLSGGCPNSPDMLGERWARLKGIPMIRFPAMWELHGLGAGFIRNAEMAQVADGLASFWDQKSKGTKHMIGQAVIHNLRVQINIIVKMTEAP